MEKKYIEVFVLLLSLLKALLFYFFCWIQILFIPTNLNLIYNDDQNIFQVRNDSIERIPHRHSHNNLNRHRRCKSKGINNFNLLEESKIIDEKLIKNENVKKCTICLGDYKLGDKISYLPCFHLYHSKCIKKWLKYSKICPLCKKEVNFENEIF